MRGNGGLFTNMVQATVWKEKLESLEQELQQCYKAQSRLSEQLVTEVAECRTLKGQAQEKDEEISTLREELKKERFEWLQMLALVIGCSRLLPA